MELHAILERDVDPKDGIWYVVSGLGDSPTMRVGHTCTYIPASADNVNGKVYFIGGANPDGPFSDVHILDLETFSWDFSDAPGFKPRYEHCSFVPSCDPHKIYVFGGAEPAGNLCDMQAFDTIGKFWTTVKHKGHCPSARTIHTTACVGSKMYVYSGGEGGVEPVKDRKVYCFDAETFVWTVLEVRGDSPKPRHGHVMVVVGHKLIVHGGMSGSTFYDDLHILDLAKLSWNSVKHKRYFPSARAAHSAVLMGTNVYICGGMGHCGALDDCYCLNTETLKWTKIQLNGPPLACRLDFASCLIKLNIPIHNSSEESFEFDTQKVTDVIENEIQKLDINKGIAFVNGKETQIQESHDTSNHGDVSEATCDSSQLMSQSITDGSTNQPQASESMVDQTSMSSNEGSTSHGTDTFKTAYMMLVHGGMDVQGNIFDDTMALLLDHSQQSE